MIICFDVGNTDIDAGIFENGEIIKSINIDYRKDFTRQQFLLAVTESFEKEGIKKEDVSGTVLCSVVAPVTNGLARALKELTGKAPLIFKNDEYADMKINAPHPEQVGLDIIAGCLMVREKGSLPAVVIDMGTATTVTAMDKEGAILGVSILTGVVTTLKALNTATGLPVDLSLTPPEKVIGYDTPTAIASGRVFGRAYAVEGMVKAFWREMGTETDVYATGGISKVIMPLTNMPCVTDENLLLKGLYEYYKNAQS